MCIGPLEYVFGKFWIWASRFLLSGGLLFIKGRDYLLPSTFLIGQFRARAPRGCHAASG